MIKIKLLELVSSSSLNESHILKAGGQHSNVFCLYIGNKSLHRKQVSVNFPVSESRLTNCTFVKVRYMFWQT